MAARALRASALLGALACSTLAARAEAQTCLSARPTEPGGADSAAYGDVEVESYVSAAGLARIFWATSGPNAPSLASSRGDGVPDVVGVAAEAADAALAAYAELGFSPVVSDADSACASNGGGGEVDIYLVDFSAADGQVIPVECATTGGVRRCAGFVLVENDFRFGGYADAAEGLRTVVPHELFHLVQDGYDADVERWWAEGTAQWAAKQVHPELEDLERFLPAYFDESSRALDAPPSGVAAAFLYGTAIWPVFLSERHGAPLVRRVFEGLSAGTAPTVLSVTDAVLGEEGSDLPSEFLTFAVYNAATGERARDGAGYANAADYPQVELTPFAAEPGASIEEIGSGLGAFYYSVDVPEPRRIELAADPERIAGVLIPIVDGQLELENAGPLPATAEGEAIVVVAGQSVAKTDAPFSLSASVPTEQPEPGSGDSGPESSGCSLRGVPLPAHPVGIAAVSLVALCAARLRAFRRRARSAARSA